MIDQEKLKIVLDLYKADAINFEQAVALLTDKTAIDTPVTGPPFQPFTPNWPWIIY